LFDPSIVTSRPVEHGLGPVVLIERAEEGVDAHRAGVVRRHELEALLEHVAPPMRESDVRDAICCRV
jgi:hypothetical protein